MSMLVLFLTLMLCERKRKRERETRRERGERRGRRGFFVIIFFLQNFDFFFLNYYDDYYYFIIIIILFNYNDNCRESHTNISKKVTPMVVRRFYLFPLSFSSYSLLFLFPFSLFFCFIPSFSLQFLQQTNKQINE